MSLVLCHAVQFGSQRRRESPDLSAAHKEKIVVCVSLIHLKRHVGVFSNDWCEI